MLLLFFTSFTIFFIAFDYANNPKNVFFLVSSSFLVDSNFLTEDLLLTGTLFNIFFVTGTYNFETEDKGKVFL